MNITEFKALPETEQDEEVADHGIFLFTYNHENDLWDVYKLFDFFVKFCYPVAGSGRPVISVITSKEGKYLYEFPIFIFSAN